MKKDLIVKLIRKAGFVWKEAKKPVLHIDTKGEMTLLPHRKCNEESGKPKLSFRIDLELTLVYVILALIALGTLIDLIFD